MNRLCVFAGTSEGRRLVELLAGRGLEITACVATEYGEALLRGQPDVRVRSGRMDANEMAEFLAGERFDLAVDATHPYAAQVTENIFAACARTGIPCLRLLRESGAEAGDGAFVPDAAACAEFLLRVEGNILLTTGSKDLPVYCARPELRERVFARVLPMRASLCACEDCGIQPSHILAMQGPFDEDMNLAMLRATRARWLVTKDSGDAGGYEAKLRAAARAGVGVVVIGRPAQREGFPLEAVLAEIEARFILAPLRKRVVLAGIGMGDADSQTLGLRRAIADADCLIGARRMLQAVRAAEPGIDPSFRVSNAAPSAQPTPTALSPTEISTRSNEMSTRPSSGSHSALATMGFGSEPLSPICADAPSAQTESEAPKPDVECCSAAATAITSSSTQDVCSAIEYGSGAPSPISNGASGARMEPEASRFGSCSAVTTGPTNGGVRNASGAIGFGGGVQPSISDGASGARMEPEASRSGSCSAIATAPAGGALGGSAAIEVGGGALSRTFQNASGARAVPEAPEVDGKSRASGGHCRSDGRDSGARNASATLRIGGKPCFVAVAPAEVARIVREQPYRNFAVLLSGDTGFYSGAKGLIAELTDVELRVLPGIGSLQYFCARLQRPWEDVRAVSLHGRDCDLARKVRTHSAVFALVGGDGGAQRALARLAEAGLGDCVAHVGERLGYPDERIRHGTVAGLSAQTFDPLSVLLVENSAARADAPSPPPGATDQRDCVSCPGSSEGCCVSTEERCRSKEGDCVSRMDHAEAFLVSMMEPCELVQRDRVSCPESSECYWGTEERRGAKEGDCAPRQEDIESSCANEARLGMAGHVWPPSSDSAALVCGLPDEAFLRGDVPMTKSEVRAVLLSKLMLRRDSVVWDVGTGSGSVAVEAARLARDGRVYAIERRPAALELARRNVEKFQLENVELVAGRAPEALEALGTPTHVFIGGSGGKLREIVRAIVARNPDARIVVSAVTLETLAELVALRAEFEFCDVTQLAVAKPRALGGYALMTAQNPIHIFAFQHWKPRK